MGSTTPGNDPFVTSEADGGFLIPEHFVEDLSDLLNHPPRGLAWKKQHKWRYRAWWLSYRVPFKWAARALMRYARASLEPSNVSGRLTVKKKIR